MRGHSEDELFKFTNLTSLLSWNLAAILTVQSLIWVLQAWKSPQRLHTGITNNDTLKAELLLDASSLRESGSPSCVIKALTDIQ